MRKKLTPYIYFLFVLAGCYQPVQAGSDDLSSTARKMLGRGIYVHVAEESASIYAAPDSGSTVSETARWFESVPIDPVNLQSAPAGWLPVKGERGKPNGWIRRRDIVIGDEMRKVTACWPVKLLHLSFGDWAGEFVFDKNGGGRIVYELGQKYPNSQARSYSHIQVYMERGVVQIVRLKTGTNDVFGPSGYKAETKALFPWGSPAEKQVNYSSAELKGCSSGPVLAKEPSRAARFSPEEWSK